jgi:flagellar basal body-associated protein FliL
MNRHPEHGLIIIILLLLATTFLATLAAYTPNTTTPQHSTGTTGQLTTQ